MALTILYAMTLGKGFDNIYNEDLLIINYEKI